ncbi:MAG: MerR family transcriptional regulator [Bacteroidales bacterium]|nr:MerR family transcriptional regulator [Bacteroidales bacterium]MDE6231123.1 MerR family transcriptional regulator [Muribaculaceae bacterium]
MKDLDKKYYKIKDVAELLNVPQSTLRYWETEFPECAPRRSATNIRYYTPENIETLRIISYLIKVKGLRIDAAKEQLRNNRKNISRRTEILKVLEDTRSELEEILAGLTKRK